MLRMPTLRDLEELISDSPLKSYLMNPDPDEGNHCYELVSGEKVHLHGKLERYS
jgi:hypothetical protein